MAFCAGNSLTTGEFPSQRPVTRSFDVFFDLLLNKRLHKQSWGWWFETPSCPLWRHRNAALYFWWPCCMRCQNIYRHNNVRVPFIPKSPIGWSHKSGPHWVHIEWCQDIEHLPSGPKCARWAKHLGWDIYLNGHTSCRPKWCMCRSLVTYHHINKWNITEVGISNNEMYMS